MPPKSRVHKDKLKDAQYDAFLRDCLTPAVDWKARTRFLDIYKTYKKWALATEQELHLCPIGLSVKISKNFLKHRSGGQQYYFCTIRKDLFVSAYED